MDRIFLSANMIELPRMLEWVRNCLISSRLEEESFYKIELAVEEVLVNIIQHAYFGEPGKIEVSFHVEPECQIEIGIRDWGAPFNPLVRGSNIDLISPIEKRREGGLGLFFISKFLDDILYEWNGTSNFLVLIKRFSQKQ